MKSFIRGEGNPSIREFSAVLNIFNCVEPMHPVFPTLEMDVVIKSLEANYRPVPGIAAATILGDGRVALILDIDAVMVPKPHAAGATTSGADAARPASASELPLAMAG